MKFLRTTCQSTVLILAISVRESRRQFGKLCGEVIIDKSCLSTSEPVDCMLSSFVMEIICPGCLDPDMPGSGVCNRSLVDPAPLSDRASEIIEERR